MNKELELLKRVKDNTLERVIDEFGTGLGELSKMQLSIWDVKTILYSEVKKIAKDIIDRENEEAMREFSR